MKLSRRKSDLEFFPTEQVETQSEENSNRGSVWAVSYADLLMVLMSFFVIFYEAKNESSEKGSLYKLAMSLGLKNEEQLTGTDKANPESTSPGNPSTKTASVSTFEKLKDTFGTRVHTEGDLLTVSFEADVFPKGSYIINDSAKKQLLQFSDIIKSHAQDLQITVVGHTDNTKLKFRSQFLTDNFDLSTLRALRALRVLVNSGLPATSLSAQGIADNQLAQRSMTITIRQKGK